MDVAHQEVVAMSVERVLFVHAHPDDETIATGGTIATLLDSGATVTLLTCTRGERGEVVPPDLQYLTGDALGEFRETELAAAMRALGLTDFRFLGNETACAAGVAPHRFRDSGMQWGADGPEPLVATPAESGAGPGSDPVTLTGADLDVIVADIAAVIADTQPTAVVSYDEGGGYGHPDHVRTHQAAVIAAYAMQVPFYAIVAAGQEIEGDLRVDVSAVMGRKKQALRAHRTQLTVDGDTIVHSGGQVEQIRGVEVFRRGEEPGGTKLDWQHLGFFTKVATCVLAFFVGGVIGAVGTANHQIAFATVSLLISAGLLVGLRLLFGTRTVAAFAALGLLLVVGAFSLNGPGGSVLIQANAAGLIWTYALPLIALVVLAWPRARRHSRDTMERETDPEKVVGAS
jgi:N-acetyl-1-D-myo-inositol-2-amino-2-deoxy-alpha-D-glucopyranoside deacetylase